MDGQAGRQASWRTESRRQTALILFYQVKPIPSLDHLVTLLPSERRSSLERQLFRFQTQRQFGSLALKV